MKKQHLPKYGDKQAVGGEKPIGMHPPKKGGKPKGKC